MREAEIFSQLSKTSYHLQRLTNEINEAYNTVSEATREVVLSDFEKIENEFSDLRKAMLLLTRFSHNKEVVEKTIRAFSEKEISLKIGRMGNPLEITPEDEFSPVYFAIPSFDNLYEKDGFVVFLAGNELFEPIPLMWVHHRHLEIILPTIDICTLEKHKEQNFRMIAYMDNLKETHYKEDVLNDLLNAQSSLKQAFILFRWHIWRYYQLNTYLKNGATLRAKLQAEIRTDEMKLLKWKKKIVSRNEKAKAVQDDLKSLFENKGYVAVENKFWTVTANPNL